MIGRAAPREYAALDGRAVVFGGIEHPQPGHRVVTRQQHHFHPVALGVAGVEGQQLAYQLERHAGLRRALQPVELQPHVGSVVGLLEHAVLLLEIEQGAGGNRHDQAVVQIGRHDLFHQVVHLDDGHHHGQHDEQHHAAHDQNEQRLQNRGQGHGAALHFLRMLHRGAVEHLRQRAGLLAQSDEGDEHGRKALVQRQRLRQRCALAHQGDGLFRVGLEQAVAQRVCSGLQRAQDGHARRTQNAQGAGETRGVDAADQPSEQRAAQHHGVERQTRPRQLHGLREHDGANREHDQNQPAPGPHEIGHGDEAEGEQRQLLVRALKHADHLWHDVGEQQHHHGDGHQHHDGRIGEGLHQLAAQRLLVFEVVGQPLHHQTQVAAIFARAHQRAVDGLEFARILSQRVAQAVTS